MNPINDKRYTVTLEYCGHAEPRHVLRFCNNFIESFTSYDSAVIRAVGLSAEKGITYLDGKEV